MARKVLISFLGTNDYVPTHYKIGDVISSLVRFVQEALIDHLCVDWNQNDRIYIFLTEAACRKNWLNFENRTGLKEVLQSKRIWPLVESVEINEGISEEEIWGLFNAIYSKLDEGDEVYFDITHAFRSIPMFVTVLMNYARFMKNISVKSILYGAFEKLGSAYEVRLLPESQRVAPVIDLTSIVRLQNLTQTASDVLNYGKIGTVGKTLSDSDYSPAVTEAVQQLKKTVETLEECIILNRARKIRSGEMTARLQANIKRLISEGELNKAEHEILSRLDKMVSNFGRNSQKNLEAAIEWALEFDMIPQAYTLGQENIKELCLKNFKSYFEDIEISSFGTRKRIVEGVLGISERSYNAGEYKDRDVFEELFASDLVQELRPYYKVLKDNRNALNHAKENSDDNSKDMTSYKEDFKRDYYTCLKILKNAPEY